MADHKRRRSGLSENIDDITAELMGQPVGKAEEPAPNFGKKRDRSWDAARSKATYDLPPALIEEIKVVAAELSKSYGKVKVSDVARLLLESGLGQYRAKKIVINPRTTKVNLFDD